MALKIAIIRGHGWKGQRFDTGAVGHRGCLEADITLNMAHQLESALHDRMGNIETMLVRGGGLETNASLIEGAEAVNHWGAKISISLHCNNASTSSARGVETWWLNRPPHQNERLARLINDSLATMYFPVGIPNRGLKTGKKFTEIHVPHCHCCLVELGFLSNKADFEFLANYERHPRIASTIASGVHKFVFG